MFLTRFSSRRLVAIVSTALVLLSACGGGGGGGGSGGGGKGAGLGTSACTETARKQWVLDTAREWYLFQDLLPASVNLGDYATAQDLLDSLTATARAQNKDRYFSYLTTQTAENSLLGEGQFIGFGFRTRTDPVNRPFIVDVFENSPASDAGVLRGDEIVAVDEGQGYVDVSQLLADGSTISDVLGPADSGVQRGLRLLRNGVTRDVSLTKRTVTIDAVPSSFGVEILPLAGTTGVGYIHLRTYISTADAELKAAFDQFRAANIDYFIVDLRYNGGGLVSTSELLADLIGGARSASDVELRLTYNANKSSNDETRFFQPQPQSVRPVRVAFLTTDATASASEIDINVTRPWIETAIVGGNTFGKPVGQLAFDLSGCDDRLRLIAFKGENAVGQTDYYDGLASSMQFACAAPDTLDKPLGDATEGMTSAALDWLSTGTCASVIASTPTGIAKPGRPEPPTRYPLPKHPTAAQRWVPGVS